MSRVDIDTVLGKINPKYDVTDHVDGMQHDPGDMVAIDFKQEYTVIIRKKKYYAITALEGNDAYVRMYQIDNFTSVQVNTSVNGNNPGSCRMSLIGNTKIICAERNEQDSTGWGSGEAGFFSMLSGWASDTNDGTTGMDVNGNYVYNNMIFNNIDDMKKMKYGSKVAEKCDFEPMDEIYVFGKSKREKDSDGKYKIYQLFFGYISDVTKSYGAGKSAPTIQISATDHLKLLQICWMAQKPAMFYNIAVAGAHYDTDAIGNIIIDDNPYANKETNGDLELPLNPAFTNVFAGRYPYEIIATCASNAGIPKKFLQKRVEQVKRIPYMPEFRSGQPVENFQSDVASVLKYCNESADKLFMEFFADEEGNLVFKIPNYTLGINALPANNAYINDQLTSDENLAIMNSGVHEEEVTQTVTTYENVTEESADTIKHTVVSGDTLWDLAETYLGDSSKWDEIWENNKSIISDPHWIYPGQVIYIKGTITSKQVEKQQQITTKKTVVGSTVSSITDKYIPVVEDKEIISFVLTDSDSQVANCFEINQEVGSVAQNLGSDSKLVTTRVVQDWASIIRFGIRPVKTISTPVIEDIGNFSIFGSLMVQRSLAQRYRGTLSMIEESSIRVGNPIRMFMYDEYPYKFNSDQLQYGPQQAVFYVESIGRDIKPDGVSTMSLTLSAGRVMGMKSIYDKMQLLYSKYYDEPEVVEYTGQNTVGATTYDGNLSELQNQIVNFAKSLLKTPYLYTGTSPSTGFDCSGFTQYVFNHFTDQTGKTLSRTTYTQINDGDEVNESDAKSCDLVFPSSGHVGIYLGNGQMIHSPHTGDVVKISDVYSGEYGFPKYIRILK